MTRHSKQHKEVVHRAEIGVWNSFYDNNWGTQKVREGADAKGDFDACVLCIHQAREPLMSPKGHIYCKGCIYEFILKQKQHKKEQLVAYEKQQAKLQADKESQQEEQKTAELEEFKKQETSVSHKVGDKRKADGPVGYVTYKTSKGDVFVVDKDIVKEHAVGTAGLNEEQKKLRAEVLPCFWVPNLTPDSGPKTIHKPNSEVTDPWGNKISIKKLKPINFTLTPEGEKNPNLRKGRFMCPLTKKTLGNGMKLFFIASTGDVVTLESKKIIEEEGNYNGKTVKKKHIIEFANNGSGFAAAGAKTVEAMSRPAFLC